MLAHRLQRWRNINPILVEYVVRAMMFMYWDEICRFRVFLNVVEIKKCKRKQTSRVLTLLSLSAIIVVFNPFNSRSNLTFWNWNVCLNTKIYKCLILN